MGKEKTPNIAIRKERIINKFYQDYYYPIYGLALYLTHDKHDADELASAFFEKICRWSPEKLENIDLEPFPYFGKILGNLHIDFIRKKNSRKEREKFYSNKNVGKMERSPEEILLSKEKIYLVKKISHEVLAKESKVIRVAFYLKTERGMKNKILAESLGISPDTFATKIRRIRLKIKEKIG